MKIQQISRATRIRVGPGKSYKCENCRTKLAGGWKHKPFAVIINVYIQGEWDHVKVWCENCYEGSGEPYGPAVDG